MHFASLNDDNIVTNVIVISEDDVFKAKGIITEKTASEYCSELLGGRWIQTWFDGSKRVRYAGIGMKYFEEYDGFGQVEQPYPSWSFDTSVLAYVPPIPPPTELGLWEWNEDGQNWVNNLNGEVSYGDT